MYSDGLAAGPMKKAKMGKDAIAEIVGIMFMSRDFAHKAHLKTGSYAQHMALGGFYDAIVDMADAISEMAFGKWGKFDIPSVSTKGNIDKPIQGLEMHMEEICDLARGCSVGAIKNELDTVEGLFLSTLYKLKELS